MDTILRQQMLAYYNERAPEYEEAYTLGTGTASITDPSIFTAEITVLPGIVRRFAHGRLMDLACGTGYWLPHYADGTSSITLFDQSEKMLDECRKKIQRYGLGDRVTLIQGDFFEHELEADAYDCVLAGFFLSHLTESQEALVFAALRRTLVSAGRFLILDSAWSPERAKVNEKAGRQVRRLNDGTRFEVYKRYFDRGDVLGWATQYDAQLSIEHSGTAFFAAAGRFDAAH
jgi:demethylmenaquinone methyltransferase/2-methoxy-6-polyprenyl-1,4-benzoquinol methylase